MTEVAWVRGDATTAPFVADSRATVLMNPPFGAQSGNEGADRTFLETAADIAAVSYSVHNAGSESFVESFVDDNDGTVTDAFAAEFDLPRPFDHHTTASEYIATDVVRIDCRPYSCSGVPIHR